MDTDKQEHAKDMIDFSAIPFQRIINSQKAR